MMDRYATFFGYIIELASRYQQGITIGEIMSRASTDKNLSNGDFGKLIEATNISRVAIYIDEIDRCSTETILEIFVS